MKPYHQVTYYKQDGYWHYKVHCEYPGFCNITSLPGDRFRTKDNAKRGYAKEKKTDLEMRKIMLKKVRGPKCHKL